MEDPSLIWTLCLLPSRQRSIGNYYYSEYRLVIFNGFFDASQMVVECIAREMFFEGCIIENFDGGSVSVFGIENELSFEAHSF